MDVAGRDDRALRRIAALLVVFAQLAERAAGRSFPVHWFLLAVLRRAEAVARAFVVEATQAAWPWFEEPLEFGDRPVDAASLALRFRTLAAWLGALLLPACRFGRRNAADDRAPRNPAPDPRPFFATSGGWMPAPYDTS